MGLETPLALLGLLAAGLPFLIHRIRQRDLPTVRLATLRLLRQARARQSRRYRITDWILLALRVGVLGLLIVGLANPYRSVPVAYGDGELASVALVLDDSLSMQRRTASGSSLASLAGRYAQEVLRSLPAGSEVAVVLAGSPPRLWQARTDQLPQTQRRLRQLDLTSHRGTSLVEAVQLATRQLAGSRLANRRLVVLTDRAVHARLAEVSWPGSDISVSIPDLESGAAPDTGNLAITRAVVQTWSDEAAEDAPLDASEAASPLALEVHVEVRRFGGKTGAGVEVHLLREGERLASSRAEFAADVAHAVLRPDPAQLTGVSEAWVEIHSQDDFPWDDRRGVLLRAPRALHVLLVNGAPHPSRHRDELRYVTPALRLAPAATGPLLPRIVDAPMVSVADLAEADVVVLANVRSLETPIAQALGPFVERGGGLLIGGGRHVDPAVYRASLRHVLPLALRTTNELGSTPLGLRFAEHPVLPAGGTGLRRAQVTTRLVLDDDRLASDLEVPIRFDDGLPMLAIRSLGYGRSALWATSLDDDWTDLPYHPGFLPLLVELVRHLNVAPPPPAGDVMPGAEIELALPANWQRAEVVDPEGRRHQLRRRGNGSATFAATLTPGPYRVLAAAHSGALQQVPRAGFVVAPPIEESDLRADSTDVPHVEADVDAPAGAGVTQRYARSTLLGWATLLALLEGAWRVRRRRPSGAPPRPGPLRPGPAAP